MGCDSGYGPSGYDSDAHSQIRGLQERIGSMEAALCGMCKLLKAKGEELPQEMGAWWEEHKTRPGCELYVAPKRGPFGIDVDELASAYAEWLAKPTKKTRKKS